MDVKRKFLAIAAIALVSALATNAYYRREDVRNSTNYSDPLRYERMSWYGISVDYRKEPLVAWKLISGPNMLKLTGGGKVQTCMDEHLRLGDRFDDPEPANIGEALDYCKARVAKM